MSGNKRNPKMGGYKGVECQDLQEEINGGGKKLPPSPVVSTSLPSKVNSFRLAGQAKISRSGQSLSIKLKEEDSTERYLTILLSDVLTMNDEHKRGEFSTCSVREYDNNPN